MPKARTIWRCAQCGHAEPKWAGRCSDCGEYGTFAEEAATGSPRSNAPSVRPVSLSDVETGADHRVPTGIGELDRVLGGGLVKGSLVLLGGEPGIGKSTLLLQLADAVAARNVRVLYVCGEESPAQVRMRADRLGCVAAIDLLPVTDVSVVEQVVLSDGYDLLVVDSIQTMIDQESSGSAGSVSQVRECTARLVRLAKDHGVTTIIVGHVTKDGSIAGPRVLEHMVDTVTYFEGDRDHAFRVVRAVKNRFGSVSEIGVFEMGPAGLEPVANPSEALLAHRPKGVAGSAVMAAMEGSRPLMVEIQALVTPSFLQMPRRLANGLDPQRLLQVLAVLERRAGLAFGQHDVYVSVAGGVRVAEPAADLPLALALASARSDVPISYDTAAFGELGLAGEVRPVPNAQARMAEAAGTGMATVITSRGAHAPAGMRVIEVSTVAEAISDLRGRAAKE